jgi:hypothetical protein
MFLDFLSQILLMLKVMPQSYPICESIRVHLMITLKCDGSVPNTAKVMPQSSFFDMVTQLFLWVGL